jgi:hypothetical protein
MCGAGVRGARPQIPSDVFLRGLANRAEANRDREAARDFRGDRRTHFDSGLL